MKHALTLFAMTGVLSCGTPGAKAQVLIGGSIRNGNLDRTHAVEIVPGFFLPQPNVWINNAFRLVSGPYFDDLSSEPWAGPAPTPVTTDGNLNGPPPDGFGGPDGGVFFKAFSGGGANGPATGHLFQDVAATPGLTYTMSGWAGAEANYLATSTLFAIDFLDGGNNVIGGTALDLVVAGLFVPNGEPFNYKNYTLSATAPAGTVNVRTRISMIGGINNPSGGGQAFVVDDIVLVVPEPSVGALTALGLAGLLAFRRGRR
jgi:hypothetical protein